jgi:hypothetical protein
MIGHDGRRMDEDGGVYVCPSAVVRVGLACKLQFKSENLFCFCHRAYCHDAPRASIFLPPVLAGVTEGDEPPFLCRHWHDRLSD